jgi:hypothetical protein
MLQHCYASLYSQDRSSIMGFNACGPHLRERCIPGQLNRTVSYVNFPLSRVVMIAHFPCPLSALVSRLYSLLMRQIKDHCRRASHLSPSKVFIRPTHMLGNLKENPITSTGAYITTTRYHFGRLDLLLGVLEISKY